MLVLCSHATPVERVDRLRRHRVEYVVAGNDRVDLSATLGTLADRYHATAVRVDAGGTLNGQLLAAGLVDEIDIVVAPQLAGTAGADPVHLVDGVAGAGGRLVLVDVRQLRDSHLRLRYTVAAS